MLRQLLVCGAVIACNILIHAPVIPIAVSKRQFPGNRSFPKADRRRTSTHRGPRPFKRRDSTGRLGSHFDVAAVNDVRPVERRLGIRSRGLQGAISLIAAGQATVSSLPLKVGRATQERPLGWLLARIEAAAEQPWATSLRHTAIPLNSVLAFLLAHLDGSHDRQMLTAKLVEALGRGEVQAPELQSQRGNITSRRAASVDDQYIERILRSCALHALLEPVCT